MRFDTEKDQRTKQALAPAGLAVIGKETKLRDQEFYNEKNIYK